MSRRPTFRVAVAWSFVLAGGKQTIMLGLTFVLAAILGPRDFGTVAMAMGYLMIAEMLLELGLVPALMQRAELREEHLDSAFWAVLIWSLVLMAISAGSAPLWADANDFPELAFVIQVLSITLPIDALTLVQRTWLQRRMDFRSLAVRSNLAVLAAGAVSLTLALAGFGVWALVWQRLTIGIVSVSLLWWISPWRPKLRFDVGAARELVGFSFGAMLSRIANFVTNRMDALVMGFFFGPVAVGIYQLGYRLVNVVLEITSRAILPVALAEFSHLQSRPDDLRRAVATCNRLSASLSIPVFAVLALSSRELLAFLGDDWAAAVYPTALLCVTGMARATTIVTGPLLRAVGRPYLDAALSWAFAIPTILSIVVVAWMVSDSEPTQQAVAIAASRAVLYGAIIFPVCSIVIWNVLPQAPLLQPFGPSVTASLAGVAFVFILRALGFVPPDPGLWMGLFEAAATAVVVGGSLLLLDADLRATLQRLAQRFIVRVAPPATAPRTSPPMPDSPRVSIGLPVYNGEQYLGLAIESILAQTFGDFELVIGDNASTDGTEEICRRFAAADPRIRYLRHPHNIGGGANFNEVYRQSRAPYFRWAAHDDLLAPRNLEACVAALDAAPEAVLAYPRTVIIDAQGRRVREHDDRMDIREPRPHQRLVRVVQAWSMCNPAFALMRRSALERTGLIRAHPSADVVMLCELALLGQFFEVPEPLFMRRVHEAMSWRAHKTQQGVALWYDPKARTTNFPHNRTRLFFRVVRAVWEFDLPLPERMRCLSAMIPAWWWRRMRVRGGALRQRLRPTAPERLS